MCARQEAKHATRFGPYTPQGERWRRSACLCFAGEESGAQRSPCTRPSSHGFRGQGWAPTTSLIPEPRPEVPLSSVAHAPVPLQGWLLRVLSQVRGLQPELRWVWVGVGLKQGCVSTKHAKQQAPQHRDLDTVDGARSVWSGRPVLAGTLMRPWGGSGRRARLPLLGKLRNPFRNSEWSLDIRNHILVFSLCVQTKALLVFVLGAQSCFSCFRNVSRATLRAHRATLTFCFSHSVNNQLCLSQLSLHCH